MRLCSMSLLASDTVYMLQLIRMVVIMRIYQRGGIVGETPSNWLSKVYTASIVSRSSGSSGMSGMRR